MKSIVLCENNLLKQSDNTNELKDIKENEESSIVLVSKPESETSVIQKVEETGELVNGYDTYCSTNDENISQNGENAEKKEEEFLSEEKDSEEMNIVTESSEVSNVSVDHTEEESKNNPDYIQTVEENGSCEFLSEDLEESNEKEESETKSDDKTESDLAELENSEKKVYEVDSIDKESPCEEKEIVEASLSTEGNLTSEKEKADIYENAESVEDIILDIDENKENEKDDKTIEGSEIVNGEKANCDIQVGEVQTVSSLFSELVWNEKQDQNGEDNSSAQENLNEESVVEPNSEEVEIEPLEKPENEPPEVPENEPPEEAESEPPEEPENEPPEEPENETPEESEEGPLPEESEVVPLPEESEIDLSNSEETEVIPVISEESDIVPIVCEESEDKVETSNKGLVKHKIKEEIMDIEDEQIEEVSVREEIHMEIDPSILEEVLKKEPDEVNIEEPVKCMKRQNREASDEDVVVKKRKFSDDECQDEIQNFEEDITEDSSRREKSPSPEKSIKLKTDAADEENESENDTENTETKPVKEEKSKKEIKAESEEKTAITSSFLASLRGTLKSLTRSDLEELIVQKLCEVITERSTVGKLRRKAQALEEDQEKWKGKVQSLTKLVREMEMIMKKYMTEVQKQREKDSTNVTPLRITRSVGLQVSFYSGANKGVKSTPTPTTTSSNSVQSKNGRPLPPVTPKLPQQTNSYSKNAWNKSTNQNSNYKSSPVPQKSPGAMQKKTFPTRNDGNGIQVNRPMVPNSGLNTRSATSYTNQAQGPRPASAKPVSAPPTAQNGSKVIDLTDDDDRQTGNFGKPATPIRVVNHLPQQTQNAQNNRFAYLLPVNGNAPGTGPSGGQNRPVFIAASNVQQSNRQLMCSMPPLLFKGGSVAQPQAQVQPQSQTLNQANRPIFPKPLRHPAPLPLRPPIQNNRPSLKISPPRPALKISKVHTGIVLSWNMTLTPEHAPISSYQLYAYQEGNTPPATSLWKKVGEVKALPLPMACTLTQFMSGHKYHFAVRAIDQHSRVGPFSFPGTIALIK